MDLLVIQAVCNSKRPEIERIHEPLNVALKMYNIDTPQREAAFLAQAAHETGGFRFLEELASGAAYEGRKDLGNTEVGDGIRYKGRGIFQLTGRANYAKCSKAIYGRESVLIDDPALLATPNAAALSAGWFWDSRGLNRFADAGDFEGLTRRINGGLNGIVERRALWKRACLALGVPFSG